MQQIPSVQAKMKTIPLFSVAKQGSILQGGKLITKCIESSCLIGPFYAPSACGDSRIRFPWQLAITLTGRQLGGSGGCVDCCFWRKKNMVDWFGARMSMGNWGRNDVGFVCLDTGGWYVAKCGPVFCFVGLVPPRHVGAFRRHENTTSYSRSRGWSLSHIEHRMPPVTTTFLVDI